MCGIFGILHNETAEITKNKTAKIINLLFRLSETRGKDSAGIVIRNQQRKRIEVLKRDITASKFILTNEYLDFYNSNIKDTYSKDINQNLAIFAHSRLVTNGSQENNGNNQPIIKSGIVAVHNGIITNVNELWDIYQNKYNRENEVDTEIFLDIIRDNINQGYIHESSVVKAFKEIEGAASIALQFSDSNKIILSTNTGSIYFILNQSKNILIFASERFILKQLIKKCSLNEFDEINITWLKPFTGLSINLDDFKVINFSFNDEYIKRKNTEVIENFIINNNYDGIKSKSKLPSTIFTSNIDKFFEFNIDEIKLLKRCTKCVLPETFPFIEFDEKGECNYCKNQNNPTQNHTVADFEKILEKYRLLNPEGPNVIVPISGGRDSVYGLHLLVNEFKMKPITFTYDWGMVTDLARRNIARITGKLGIENIVVSADIRKKRKYIQQNINAWLKKPDLGIIPLFMAGDKYFFRIVNHIKRETGINIDIWSSNKYENTEFKVGFCGVKPNFDKNRIDGLKWKDKLKLPKYYLLHYFLNSGYFNSSLFDTIGAFYSYYIEPREGYHLMFDYVKWDEEIVEKTIVEKYNFEKSKDTNAFWRIGDGTASFYNYIYYTVAGFSEFETFRSNQIRDGSITREKAIEKIYIENVPRIESFLWYCETIDVNPEKALKAINNISKLYRL